MAAAYAALVSLFNNLEDIKNHPRHSFSFDENQIQSLFQSVTFLIEFMESYDNCHGPSKDAAILLQMRITIAAQAAEQVLESHVVDQILGGKKRSPRFLLDLEKVAQDMDYVKRKAMKVQQARSGLDQLLKNPTTYSSSTPLTSEKISMVGFDELMLQLLDVLTGYPPSRGVIPIVGTGGVGKTTLARNAFQHSLIAQHFDVCLWATISQQYVVQDILSTLVSGQGKSNISNKSIGELGEQLHKRLYGRRYLIVLDDMWSVTAWDEMNLFLPDTSNGSRIIVTTRQSDVADYTGSGSCLSVSLLDDDNSWVLFCEKSFEGEDCPPQLQDVGRRIVRKCKGLPLAIVVIAGHLRKSKRNLECWENVANDMMSVLNSKENKHFLNVLSFSYTHLPVHLKPCFVYMGTFPEDEEIDVSNLINQWIAEGFLKPCKGDKLEAIAKDYLKDLIDRNLIISQSEFFCRIHDVLRELCLKVAENEMFFYMVDTDRSGGRCRKRRVGGKAKNQEEKHHLVRSMNCRKGKELFELRFCRILIQDRVEGGFLMADDLQHVNLRYLHYSNVGGRHASLPSSISLFWNLQTLIIEGLSSCAIIAPNEIWEMIHLRHLAVNYSSIILPSDDKLEQANDELIMPNLHTLLGVENLKLSEEVCKRVPNIKNLKLQYSGGDTSDYCPHNFGYLQKLESLTLYISADFDSCWHEFVLSLTFPSSLKELSLSRTRLDWEDMTTMVRSLPYLETLDLGDNSVIGSEWTPVEGDFLRLKTLKIFFCYELVNWNADSSHFPVFENIFFFGVTRLDEFPLDIGTIPTLHSITLIDCRVSLAISALRMLVEQEEDYGNEGIKLDIGFYDVNDLEMFKKEMEEEGLTSNNLSLNKGW